MAAKTLRGESARIVGLADLQRELRRVDMTRDLRAVNKAAAELVVRRAAAAFSARSDVAREVVASIRAEAQQRSASVRLGGAGAKASALGAEFGSIRYTQFRPWTGNGRTAGYSLYPTIRASADEIVEYYARAVDELTARAFPD